METLLNILSSYYYIFIIIALIGIFAIVGYFVDKKYPKVEKESPEINMDAVAAKSTVGLGTSLNQNPTINQEQVEQLDMNPTPNTAQPLQSNAYTTNTTPTNNQ